MASINRDNQWVGLLDDFIIRVKNAFKSIYFIGFFIIGILTFGAMGIWLPPYRFDDIVFLNSESLFTYSGPILGMLLAEFFIQAKKDKLAIVALMLGILSFLLISMGYYKQPKELSNLTIMGTLLTLILFVLVNANDPKFDEVIKPVASATGYTTASLENIQDGQ